MRRLRWHHWLLVPLFVPLMICMMLALAVADVIDPDPDIGRLYPKHPQRKP